MSSAVVVAGHGSEPHGRFAGAQVGDVRAQMLKRGAHRFGRSIGPDPREPAVDSGPRVRRLFEFLDAPAARRPGTVVAVSDPVPHVYLKRRQVHAVRRVALQPAQGGLVSLVDVQGVGAALDRPRTEAGRAQQRGMQACDRRNPLRPPVRARPPVHTERQISDDGERHDQSPAPSSSATAPAATAGLPVTCSTAPFQRTPARRSAAASAASSSASASAIVSASRARRPPPR